MTNLFVIRIENQYFKVENYSDDTDNLKGIWCCNEVYNLTTGKVIKYKWPSPPAYVDPFIYTLVETLPKLTQDKLRILDKN